MKLNKSKTLAIVLGGLGLIAGAVGTIAVQSHAQTRAASAAPSAQTTNSTEQSVNSSTSSGSNLNFSHTFTKPAAVGTVTAISGNIITLQSKSFNKSSGSTNTTATSVTYTVDATNATIQKITPPAVPVAGTTSPTPGTKPTRPAPTTIQVSQIAVGDTLVVQGTVSGTNITATKITDGAFIGGRGLGHKTGSNQGARGTVGTVTSVNGDIITIQSKSFSGNSSTTAASVTYTVDATNATVQKIAPPTTSPTPGTKPVKPTPTTIQVSQIAVGDTLVIQGTISGTNITATKITDGAFIGGRGFGGHKQWQKSSTGSTSSTTGSSTNN